MTVCKHCGKPLSLSQYARERTYKSCPKCSVEDGVEHIYYFYPARFGTTPLRATNNTPDGAQSYCVPCRRDCIGPHHGYIKCSDLL